MTSSFAVALQSLTKPLRSISVQQELSHPLLFYSSYISIMLVGNVYLLEIKLV